MLRFDCLAISSSFDFSSSSSFDREMERFTPGGWSFTFLDLSFGVFYVCLNKKTETIRICSCTLVLR